MNREIYDAALALACRGAAESGFLNGRRVLITGATGLIGSFLVESLLWLNDHAGAGVRVCAAARSAERMSARFGGQMARGDLIHVPYDAGKSVDFDFDVDYIVHAACSAHPMAYSTDPAGTMRANLLGTLELLEYQRRHPGAVLLFLSTGEIYGENPELPEGFGEEDRGWVDPMLPRSCYPESKRAAETLCAGYAAQYGCDARVARLCHVYGPTFTPSNSRADAQFIRRALAGEDIVMKSAGSQVRSFCHVADAASALLTILERGQAGLAVNVANRRSVASIREYAETLAEIAGVRVVFDLPPEAERAGYSRVTRAVLNPARLEGMGWSGAYALREGLEQTYRALKE